MMRFLSLGSLALLSPQLIHAWLQPISPQTSGALTRLSASTTSTSTTPRINPAVTQIQPSKTVEIFSKVKQMQDELNMEITSLCVGEPDFPPPQIVLDATKRAIDNNDTKYTAVTGTLELRTAICNDLERRKHVKYTPNQIVVSNGAKQSVWQGLLAVAGAGDQVLVPAPYWPSYPEQVRLCGAEPVVVESDAANEYLLTGPQLCTALEQNPATTCVILCNPSNPTGSVYGRAQLEELCAVLREDFPHVVVLADEIYERLAYGDSECVSVASLPGMFERTITVNGFSKAYAMTGYRLGYAAAPTLFSTAMATLQSQFTSCASSIAQAAAVAALTLVPEEELQGNVQVTTSSALYRMGHFTCCRIFRTIPMMMRSSVWICSSSSSWHWCQGQVLGHQGRCE
jgi:bifunctional aspartate aminotransferase and glutamate/aspartate-prephenate aminotransferase